MIPATYMPVAGAAFGALSLLFAGLAVSRLFGERRRHTIMRLRSIAGQRLVATEQHASEVLRQVSAVDRELVRVPIGAWLQRDLVRAGLAWHLRDYVGFVALGGIAAGMLAAMLVGSPIAVIPAAIVGGLVPVLIVKRTASTRANELNAQVVDMIDLIASSLRSGFGFMQAIELAAREQSDPIAGELARTIAEINLGMSTEDALVRLVERCADQDLELVVTAVLIQRRVGGNLAEVLENISHMIRDRVKVRGEIKTLTAQSRMSSWIVGLLPVILGGVFAVLQPEHMEVLVTDPIGKLLAGIAIVLEVVGFVLVRRIAAIDY